MEELPVVPTTTSPWFWPSNGKILRGPLLNFLNPTTYGVIGMYIWLIAPNLSFDDWKPKVMWSFIDPLNMMVNLSYLLLDPMSQLVVESSYFEFFFMVWYLLYPVDLTLAPHKPSNWFTLFTLPMTLFTLRRLVIFYHSNGPYFHRDYVLLFLLC